MLTFLFPGFLVQRISHPVDKLGSHYTMAAAAVPFLASFSFFSLVEEPSRHRHEWPLGDRSSVLPFLASAVIPDCCQRDQLSAEYQLVLTNTRKCRRSGFASKDPKLTLDVGCSECSTADLISVSAALPLYAKDSV